MVTKLDMIVTYFDGFWLIKSFDTFFDLVILRNHVKN